jgi:hypothetical protein
MEPRYLHLRPEQAPPILEGGPFRAVIVADEKVSETWRRHVADWIVESGCLYVMAWGIDCEKWHDGVDWAVLEKFDYADIPDDRFVMTTWHADEPLTEAFWYADNCANHPDIDLEHTYIVHVSGTENAPRMLRIYADSQRDDGV